MGQLLNNKQKGLWTNPNEFAAVPLGAMRLANNCVVDADDVLEQRRGNGRLASLPLSDDRASRFASFESQIMAAWTGGKVGYRNASTFTALTGTYNHPDANLARTRFVKASESLFFQTSAGVYNLTDYNGTPTLAGVPKGLDIQLALSGATGFMATANQVGYRVLWGIRDSTNRVKQGAPSGRAVITNSTGGARDVALTITIPSGITTSYFFKVYRTKVSGSASVVPDDEFQLVYENNPTAGEITAGTLTFTDATTEDLRGETLYSSPSQEGPAQANDRPPQADDIELFAGSMFYANCKSKHRKILTLLSASALTANDTLTIAGTVYTVKAAENTAAGEFQKFTAGTPAQNIFDTTSSLVRVINRYATNTLVYAYYLSGPNDLPGQILLEERGIGGASFAVIASAAGTAYNPVLPTSGTSVSSTNDDFQHVLFFSKTDEHEAVPLVNYRFVGSANNPIRRIKKLRNTLFIFKENEGIFKCTGSGPEDFAVDEFDSSAKLLAPDSVAVVNNQLWCLCDQGVTIVTETGASTVSRPIEDLIQEQFGLALTQVKYYSHGIGYESDRKYILCTVSSSADTYATQAFVFNVFTKAWTRWPLNIGAGFVHDDDNKLYLAEGDSSWVLQERKNFDYTDYVDEELAYTLVSYSGTQVVLNTTSEIEVGDVLYLSASVQSLITAVEPGYVTVEDTLTWVAGAVSVFKGIQAEAEWVQQPGGNPGTLKQFPCCSLMFRNARFNEAQIGFATAESGYFEDVTIEGNRTGLWGLFPWGEEAWGATPRTVPIYTEVPLEKQFGSWISIRFKIRQGYSSWKLLGYSLPVQDDGSTLAGVAA